MSSRDAGRLLLSLAALFSLASLWDAGRRAPGIDFYQFWVGGQAVLLDDPADLYSVAGRSGIAEQYYRQAQQGPEKSRFRQAAAHRQALDTYATPFLYTVFALASPRDYAAAYTAFHLLSLLSLVLSLACLGRCVGASAEFSLALFVVVSLWFSPLLSDIHVANVNQIQLGLLAAFLWIRLKSGRPWREPCSGLLLGLGLAFKPNLLFVAVVLGIAWAFQGRRRELIATGAGLVAGLLAAFAVASLFFDGAACWAQWFAALRALPRAIIPVAAGNYAMGIPLSQGLGFDASWALFVAFLGATVVALWRGRKRPADLGAVAAGCLLYLLCAPLAWLHYYLLALPALIFVLRHAAGSRPMLRGLLAAAALTAISLEPLLGVVSFSRDPRLVLLGLGTLLLFGLTLHALAQAGGAAGSPQDEPLS